MKRLMKGGKRKGDSSASDAKKKAKSGPAAECEPGTLEQLGEWAQEPMATLKTLCKERGLPVSGKKSQLLVRLYTGEKHSQDKEEDIGKEIFGKNPILTEYFNKAAESELGFKANKLRIIGSLMYHYPFVITSAKEAVKLKGIGKSSEAKIKDLLGGKENVGTEIRATLAPAPRAENPTESVPQPGSSSAFLSSSQKKEVQEEKKPDLSAQLLELLQQDESDDGIHIDQLTSKLSASSEDVRAALTGMCDEGQLYTTTDEDHFKFAG